MVGLKVTVLVRLAVHVYDSLVKLLLTACLLRLTVLLSISNDVLKAQLAFLELLTLAAVE